MKNLPPGEYEITAEGRSLGKQKADRLAAGLNIGSDTANGFEPGGPWDAQCDMVRKLVDARNDLSEADSQSGHFLANRPQTAALVADFQKTDDSLTALARETAKPYPYHFVIQRVP